MKKLFLMIVLAIGMTAEAQVVDTGMMNNDKEAIALKPDSVSENGEWQQVIADSTFSAADGYKYARQALAKIVPDYQHLVKMEDEAEKLITCEVPLSLFNVFYFNGSKIYFQGSYLPVVTLLFKDGRFKVKAENVTCSYKEYFMGEMSGVRDHHQFMAANISANLTLQENFGKRAGEFLAKLHQTMVKQKSDNDF